MILSVNCCGTGKLTSLQLLKPVDQKVCKTASFPAPSVKFMIFSNHKRTKYYLPSYVGTRLGFFIYLFIFKGVPVYFSSILMTKISGMSNSLWGG